MGISTNGSNGSNGSNGTGPTGPSDPMGPTAQAACYPWDALRILLAGTLVAPSWKPHRARPLGIPGRRVLGRKIGESPCRLLAGSTWFKTSWRWGVLAVFTCFHTECGLNQQFPLCSSFRFPCFPIVFECEWSKRLKGSSPLCTGETFGAAVEPLTRSLLEPRREGRWPSAASRCGSSLWVPSGVENLCGIGMILVWCWLQIRPNHDHPGVARLWKF